MPRYLVQTESGSWYQVDTEAHTVLRWSGHGIRGSLLPRYQASQHWQDMKCIKFLDPVTPRQPMRFRTDDHAEVTTSPVRVRVVIEDISKRRAVPV